MAEQATTTAVPVQPGSDDALREQVLDAADRLYYSRGVQAVGMDELRAAAGVPLKRLYRLFGSKDGISRIRAGEDPAAIARSWSAGEGRWRLLRNKYLLYR